MATGQNLSFGLISKMLDRLFANKWFVDLYKIQRRSSPTTYNVANADHNTIIRHLMASFLWLAQVTCERCFNLLFIILLNNQQTLYFESIRLYIRTFIVLLVYKEWICKIVIINRNV